MADFFVNPPNYRPADYSFLGNLPNQFYQGAQEKQQYDLSHAFSNGVPMNPDGTVNAQALLQIFGKNGDVSDIPKLSNMALQQQQLRQSSSLNPLLAGGGGGSVPVAPPAAAPAPSQGAQPQAPTAPRFSGETVSAITDSVLPDAAKSGVVARNVARVVGVDPDATLTPEQAQKAQSLITGYLTRTGQIQPSSAPQSSAFDDALRTTLGFEGGLNPKDTNGTPSNFGVNQKANPDVNVRALTPQTAAPIYKRRYWDAINGDSLPPAIQKMAFDTAVIAGPEAAKKMIAASGGDPQKFMQLREQFQAHLLASDPSKYGPYAAAWQQRNEALSKGFEQGQSAQGGHPITPAVPLPQGYTDPEQAILGIDREIARMSNNPYDKGQVAALEDWRTRIADSVKPIKVGMYDTFVDPRTGRPLTEGAYAQGNAAETGATLDLDAQRYLQTGTLPPNMGRGIQGAAQATAIRARAQELATEQGIDPATLPERWQAYRAHQAGLQRFTSGPQGNAIRSFNVLVDHLGTLDQAAAALHNGNIKAFNHVANAIAEQTGKPAPTNFAATKALVGDEIVKAIVGGGGALGDREEVKRAIDAANSPEQLAGVIEQYKRLALGQLHGLQKQYEVSTGQSNFNDLLSPGTLKFFGDQGQVSPPSAQSSGHAGQRLSPQQASKLPAGTQFVGLDGQTYVKH